MSGSEGDAPLIERVLAGDDAAFGLLIARHKHWLHRFVRRYVGEHEAYDVVQDSFFAAWRSLRSYRDQWSFEIWLRRIALNKCRDRARRAAVRRWLGVGQPGQSGADELPELPDEAPGPERLADAAQQAHALQHALVGLPRGLREPLLLTTLEGLSHAQAGEVLHLSAKAVELRVRRARARLQIALQQPD